MVPVTLSEIERKNVITRLRDWIKAVNGFHWLFDQQSTVTQALCEFIECPRGIAASWDVALKAELWKEAVK